MLQITDMFRVLKNQYRSNGSSQFWQGLFIISSDSFKIILKTFENRRKTKAGFLRVLGKFALKFIFFHDVLQKNGLGRCSNKMNQNTD